MKTGHTKPAGATVITVPLWLLEPGCIIAKLGYTFPVLVDPNDETGRIYGLTGVPETYIVDKQGVLREKFIGPVRWDAPGARQMLMKYILQ